MLLRWLAAAFLNLRAMIRYPKIHEVIHDGSKPPKLGSFTPPPYWIVRLVVKHHNNGV